MYNEKLNSLRIPARIAKLKISSTGFPVPWFVAWIDGVPDFRAVDGQKFQHALRFPTCWICGEPMGQHRVFIIGPMCSINRVISEPPSHRDCAEFSVKACPFLSNPRMKRNEKNMPSEAVPAPGEHIARNPGAMCLWETPDYKPFKVNFGNAGILFRLGDPVRVDWYCEGRLATYAEVRESINTGYPTLMEMTVKEGPEAVAQLRQMARKIEPHLPREQ